MNYYIYPGVQERFRTTTFSQEAHCVTVQAIDTHAAFIGESVFIRELYRQNLKSKFDFYKSIWRAETIFSSSTSDIINNAAYRSIVGLGPEVLPFIFDDLRRTNAHWFYALESLTGQNPIPNEHRGIIPLMTKDWLRWADENNQSDESSFSTLSQQLN